MTRDDDRFLAGNDDDDDDDDDDIQSHTVITAEYLKISTDRRTVKMTKKENVRKNAYHKT